MFEYTVLVTTKSFAKENDQPIRLLESAGCRVKRIDNSKTNIIKQLHKELPQVDAVIAGLEEYDQELIAVSDRLKVISRYGVGYDAVDVNAANKKGVVVTITPGANENSVADFTIAMLLAAARHIPVMDYSIKSKRVFRPMGQEIWGKKLGVIGLGRIGKGVVKRAAGFEMEILCYDMFPDTAYAKANGIEYCDLDALCRNSDFITLHAPLNDTTRNMIGLKQLKIMKPTSILINTARGGLIDEEALYKALVEGEIAAACLDATLKEPPIDSPLASLHNCILTPHAGAATVESSYNMSMLSAQNVIDVLKKGNCVYSV